MVFRKVSVGVIILYGWSTIFLHSKKGGWGAQSRSTVLIFRKMFAVVYGFGAGAESYPSWSIRSDTEIIESLESIMTEHSQCETDARVNHL